MWKEILLWAIGLLVLVALIVFLGTAFAVPY